MSSGHRDAQRLTDDDQRAFETWRTRLDSEPDDQAFWQRAARIPGDCAWRTDALAELVQRDLVRRWHSGRRIFLESYLGQYPELAASGQVAVNLIQAEYNARCAAGEPVALESYAFRFPAQFPELRQRIDPQAEENSPPSPRTGAAPIAGEPAETAWATHSPALGRIGRYRLVERLGRTAMGSVYLAGDTELKRWVAVKVPDVSGGADAMQRFQREALALAAIDHPNICQVLDYGVSDGIPYLAMPFIPGRSLADEIPDGGLCARRAATIVMQLARAMHRAHLRGVLHRDLKPANVLMKHDGVEAVPIIVDFGFAAYQGCNHAAISVPSQALDTFDYRPLEQLQAENDTGGPECDVYALGVILYELLTGHRPFEGKNLLEIVEEKRAHAPRLPTASQRDIPPRLEEICLKAMARDAADRYRSMDAFADALSEFRDDLRHPGAGLSPREPIELPRDGIPASKSARKFKRHRITAIAVIALAGIGLIAQLVDLVGRIDRRALEPGFPVLADDLPVKPAEIRPDSQNRTAPADPQMTAAQAVTNSQHATSDEIDVPSPELTNSIGMKLVLIPPGDFAMGSPNVNSVTGDLEQPRHTVRLTHAIYLGATEVTQGQYQAVTGENPSSFTGAPNLPVESVSWYDAIQFCNKLSEREHLPPFYHFGRDARSYGNGYRLPTEAEWEHACRARTRTWFNFGNDPANLGEHAWTLTNSERKTHPVAEWPPNAFGLYDMHGNVWEWCWDWLDPTYYSRSPANDPLGPTGGDRRIHRGGSWHDLPLGVRSANRHSRNPNSSAREVGFRVARDEPSRYWRVPPLLSPPVARDREQRSSRAARPDY